MNADRFSYHCFDCHGRPGHGDACLDFRQSFVLLELATTCNVPHKKSFLVLRYWLGDVAPPLVTAGRLLCTVRSAVDGILRGVHSSYEVKRAISISRVLALDEW